MKTATLLEKSRIKTKPKNVAKVRDGGKTAEKRPVGKAKAGDKKKRPKSTDECWLHLFEDTEDF